MQVITKCKENVTNCLLHTRHVTFSLLRVVVGGPMQGTIWSHVTRYNISHRFLFYYLVNDNIKTFETENYINSKVISKQFY